MKRIFAEFVRRGLVACGFGPLFLAVLYLILQDSGQAYTLTVNEVCTGIISLSVLAFVAGGMNVLYQIERLPLLQAILIHGTALYIAYFCTYIINGWLKMSVIPIIIFSIIFVVGYILIWIIIYSIIKNNTKKLNEKLKQKQKAFEE